MNNFNFLLKLPTPSFISPFFLIFPTISPKYLFFFLKKKISLFALHSYRKEVFFTPPQNIRIWNTKRFEERTLRYLLLGGGKERQETEIRRTSIFFSMFFVLGCRVLYEEAKNNDRILWIEIKKDEEVKEVSHLILLFLRIQNLCLIWEQFK